MKIVKFTKSLRSLNLENIIYPITVEHLNLQNIIFREGIEKE